MKLSGITKYYGDNRVFENFSLDIKEREILALLGASGCGKTTLLNIVSGLTDYVGTVEKNGEKVSYLFQEQRLIPNLTVFKNVEYVLKNNLNKFERQEKTEQVLKKVELWDERNAYPSALSGGMAQRAALARAFAFDAPLLLMDEPFKGLDISLKKRVMEVFVKLYDTDRRTTIFVTHDIDDAFLIADRIIVLEKGGRIAADVSLEKPVADRVIGDFGELKSQIYDVM